MLDDTYIVFVIGLQTHGHGHGHGHGHVSGEVHVGIVGFKDVDTPK